MKKTSGHWFFGVPAFCSPAFREGLVPFFLALALCFAAPVTAQAALADDSTVLSYLIDMQRRSGKGCNGAASAPVASVVPSEALRGIAALALGSGRGAGAILAEKNLGVGDGFGALVSGATAHEALAQLVNNQCAAMMNPSFTRIGTAKQGNSWFVVMAQEDPRPLDQQPATLELVPGGAGQTNAPVSPATPLPAGTSGQTPGLAPANPAYQGAPLAPVGPLTPATPITPVTPVAPPARVSSDPTVQPLAPPPSLAPLAPVPLQPVSPANTAPQLTVHDGMASPPSGMGKDSFGRTATELLPADPVPTGVYSTGTGVVKPIEPVQTAPILTPDVQEAPQPTGHGGAANPHFRKGQDPIIARSATESLPADPVPTGVYSTGTGVVKPIEPGQAVPAGAGRP